MKKLEIDSLIQNLIGRVEQVKAVALVDKDGLILTSILRDENAEDDIIGATTAMFDIFISRVKTEFGSADEFLNIMSAGTNKFLFTTAGKSAILTIISDLDARDNALKVYGQHVAKKIELLLKYEDVDLEFPPILELLANMRSGALPKGDFSAKIIVLGDPMTGKTSLIRRFVDNAFKESYISTIGVDISRKAMNLGENTAISLNIWDIGGQMQTMAPYRKRFYQGVGLCVLQFDISRKGTFDHIDAWIEDLAKSIEEDIPYILIANKMDLPNHEVSLAEIQAKADELACPYILCSAKTGSNVIDAFMYASYKFCEKL